MAEETANALSMFFLGSLVIRPGRWWTIQSPRAQSSWCAQNGRDYPGARRYGHQNNHAEPAMTNHTQKNEFRNILRLSIIINEAEGSIKICFQHERLKH